MHGGITPLALYHGVLSDRAWCGHVVFVLCGACFPSTHSALGFETKFLGLKFCAGIFKINL